MASPSEPLTAEEMFAKHPNAKPTEEWLSQLAMTHAMFNGATWTPQQWLLDNGIRWAHSPRPKRLRQGEMKRCYQNSIELVSRGKGRYVYCEGMATHLIPVEHAWCLDRKTGLIVDPTWNEGHDYIGVPIQRAYAWRVLRAGRQVVFDWEGGYPIITGTVPASIWREPLDGGANA